MAMNTDVDNYFVEGCGRCELYATPQCKVHLWPKELEQLRRIAQECELNEVSKWGVPCYTDRDKNIINIGAFRGYCAISFFKGALLQDEYQILDKPGENSREGRYLKFTNVQDIIEKEAIIKAYIHEAIEVERAGLKIPPLQIADMNYPIELTEKFDSDPTFQAAFEALTPGRQRGYLIHFNQTKNSATRISRIEKCTSNIMNGVGLHDKYKS